MRFAGPGAEYDESLGLGRKKYCIRQLTLADSVMHLHFFSSFATVVFPENSEGKRWRDLSGEIAISAFAHVCLLSQVTTSSMDIPCMAFGSNSIGIRNEDVMVI